MTFRFKEVIIQSSDDFATAGFDESSFKHHLKTVSWHIFLVVTATISVDEFRSVKGCLQLWENMIEINVMLCGELALEMFLLAVPSSEKNKNK